MDLRKGPAADSSPLTSSASRETQIAESVYAKIASYANALFSSRTRTEVAALTERAVRSLLDVEDVEVLFNFGASKTGDRSAFLSAHSVPVRGASGTIATIWIWEKKDWSPVSSEEAEIMDALAAPLGLRLESLRLEDELSLHQAGSVRALAAAIEVKDRYTSGHTKRVGFYADLLTEYLPISDEEKEKIRLAGILHDIGKIGVPDRILLKPDKLTGAEWDEMRLHTEAGFDIVSQVAGLEEIAEILRHHHERWDGTGYPRGLRADEIPFASRVIAVADTFDAIVTDRPYRPACTPAEARDIIIPLAGIHFDAVVIAAFERAFFELEAHVLRDRKPA